MRLSDWLKSQGVSIDVFASEIGVRVSTVYRLKDGLCFPSRATLAQIMRATGGAVTANDFVDLERPAHVEGARGRPRGRAPRLAKPLAKPLAKSETAESAMTRKLLGSCARAAE